MQPAQFNQTALCESRHWWFVARREMLLAVVREALSGAREPLVVDVGCCTGGNCEALAREFAVVGIDPASEAIALARERFPQARFICGTAPDDLGELANRADLWLLADVLEHVRQDREMLAALVAAARPGAHFVVTVPAEMALWSPHDESHGHFRRYDRTSLSALWSGLPV